MNISLIGTGKTGGKILELTPKENIIGIFNSRNPPQLEQLKKSQVVISFIPGTAVDHLIPQLSSLEVPIIWGSTGYTWNKNLNVKAPWIYSSNFSGAMVLIRKVMNILAQAPKILKDCKISLKEIHHTHKKDAPSGTALLWQDWLQQKLPITSLREGDVVGIHELKIETPFETITLTHEAKDRALFAAGALWVGEKVHELWKNKKIPAKIYSLDEFLDQYLKELL